MYTFCRPNVSSTISRFYQKRRVRTDFVTTLTTVWTTEMLFILQLKSRAYQQIHFALFNANNNYNLFSFGNGKGNYKKRKSRWQIYRFQSPLQSQSIFRNVDRLLSSRALVGRLLGESFHIRCWSGACVHLCPCFWDGYIFYCKWKSISSARKTHFMCKEGWWNATQKLYEKAIMHQSLKLFNPKRPQKFFTIYLLLYFSYSKRWLKLKLVRYCVVKIKELNENLE